MPGARLEQMGADVQEAQEVRAAWDEGVKGGLGWEQEFHLTGRTQAELHMVVTALPLTEKSAAEDRWLVTVQDISKLVIHARQLEIYAQEISRLYRSNRQHLQQLQEAERSREMFFSLVTHELKTPLTSQKAALELLTTPELRPSKPEDMDRLADSLYRSTLRLERLINDLLDIATARSGKLSLFFHKIDMLEVVENVLEEMVPLIREKNLILRWRPGRSLVEALVNGDETRLTQMVQNLLSNAVKAAPNGSTLGVTLKQEQGQVTVSVSNDGSIDPAIKDTLFEPFTKSPSGGYRPGAGLGLAVVTELARAHHGTIKLVPNPKRVIFSFAIPSWVEENV